MSRLSTVPSAGSCPTAARIRVHPYHRMLVERVLDARTLPGMLRIARVNHALGADKYHALVLFPSGSLLPMYVLGCLGS